MSSVPSWALSASRSSWRSSCSAAAERIGAGILLAGLLPVFLVIWVTILVLSGKSPLIAHKRVGQNGSELWVLKFRTMWTCRVRPSLRDVFSIGYIDDEIGPSRKSPGDPRIWSRFARFCRRHSLDELPQLLNVVAGQMSLVGPRPVTPAEVVEIYGSRAEEVLSAKPGLSGLWQISGRNRLSIEQRRHLDLECVRHRSAGMYFRILLRTVSEVLTGESAW